MPPTSSITSSRVARSRPRLNIGVVEGIVCIGQWDVTIDGFGNHAGTTPMDKRRDALMAASKYVQLVNRVATSEPGRQVGTVGRLQAFPGAPNVIPGQVQATLEFRDLDQAKVLRLGKTVMDEAVKIGAENGTTFTFKQTYLSTPAIMDSSVQKVIETSAKGLGLTTKYMPSGAGHDAQYMAQIAPSGMIFCPSVGGISHSPKEFSKPQDIVNGANVLLQTILALDASELRGLSSELGVAIAAICIVVSPTPGHAQSSGSGLIVRSTPASSITRASRITQAPVLDGRDDDPAWRDAMTIDASGRSSRPRRANPRSRRRRASSTTTGSSTSSSALMTHIPTASSVA